MPSRFLIRCVLAIAIGLLTAGAVLAAYLGKGSGDEGSGPIFRFELRAGSAFEARLPEAVTIKTEYAFQTIPAKHIRRITFGLPEGGDHRDVIELSDKSQLRGVVFTQQFEWPANDNEAARVVRRDDVREIKSAEKPPTGWTAILFGLLTLTAMEIVLGIDNVIFLAIIAGKLPPEKQPRARKLGLAAALGTRLLLLATLSFLIGLTKPIFTLPDLPLLHDLDAREISVRDLILLIGGLFLIGKSVTEIHAKLEAADEEQTGKPPKAASFGMVLIQIALIDIIFSLDSVITAVGMVEELWVMVVAMVLAMLVMMAFAGTISDFVARHPTLKMLALSFLILIGVMLTAESLGQHMDKGYIYFAMAFAVVVEILNIRLRRKLDPLKLHGATMPHQ
jgi:predicted tellurium resistance membrane protein TerC